MTDWKWNDSEDGWIANAPDEDTSLIVAGSREFPEPHLCSAALAHIANADTFKTIIADALDRTPIEVHSDDHVLTIVHPERPSVDLIQLEMRDPTNIGLIHLFVTTGYPDPNYLYEVSVENMTVINIAGGFW